MAGISMKELADILGVSTASVSVALRGMPGISEETRQRILTEAQQRGYDMNRLSTAQARGTIAIIDYTYYLSGPQPGDTYSYYTQFADAAAACIVQHGYTAAGPFHPSPEWSLKSRPADGYILLGAGITSEQLDGFMTRKVPFVVAGNPLDYMPVTTVTHDNGYGIHAVMAHLREQGHREIGYIASLTGPAGEERLGAYLREISANAGAAASTQHSTNQYPRQVHGASMITPPPASFLDIRSDTHFFDTEQLLERIGNWLDTSGPAATAFVCDNDFTAASLMRALRSRGLTPGKDVAVTGFDDLPFSALLEPPLTSIHTFEPELAAACVEQLIYTMEHPKFSHRHIKIGTKLVARTSTQTHPDHCPGSKEDNSERS